MNHTFIRNHKSHNNTIVLRSDLTHNAAHVLSGMPLWLVWSAQDASAGRG
jgi:hypothetical protein